MKFKIEINSNTKVKEQIIKKLYKSNIRRMQLNKCMCKKD